MIIKMTKRDKKLLSGLGVFCVTVFFAIFAIAPLHKANEHLSRQIRNNEEQIAEMEDKAAKLPALREMNRAGQASLGAAQEGLYPLLKSQDIDRLLMDIVMAHGLSARKLQIIMHDEPANVTVYGGEGSEGSNPEYEDGVWIATVVLDVSGKTQPMDALIDELATKTSGVRIAGLSWNQYGRDPENLLQGPPGQEHMLRLQLEILMSGKD